MFRKLQSLCRSTYDNDDRRDLITTLCNCIEGLGPLGDDDRMDLLRSLYRDNDFNGNENLVADSSELLRRGNLEHIRQARQWLMLTERHIRERIGQPAQTAETDVTTTQPDLEYVDWW